MKRLIYIFLILIFTGNLGAGIQFGKKVLSYVNFSKIISITKSFDVSKISSLAK